MIKYFVTPIDASRRNPALGSVAGVELLGINYERDVYRFSPVDADGNRLVDDLVLATDPVDSGASEADAVAHITAYLTA